jgi:hypothetical protein
LEAWKQEVADRLRRFASRARAEAESSAPYLLNGGLAVMALWPIVQAVQAGELAALNQLFLLAGGGTNLIASQMQSWKDGADGGKKLAQAAQAD